MEWFRNGVLNAINECRQKTALLIVYAKDSSDASITTSNSWEDPKVQEVLSSNLYVALELTKDSVEFYQFSQLFPVLMVPSVFCISPTGDQLSVFSGVTDAHQLVLTLNQGFQKMAGDSEQNNDASLEEPEELESPSKEETSEEEIKQQKEEQIRRYREKMRQRRVEKEDEQEQRERSREIRRRKEGQEIGQWKQDQEERERQKWIKDRQKEKAEQQRARQEVLAKLEQDKLERQSRKRITDNTDSSSSIPTDPVGVPSVFSAVRSDNLCRIQVKLLGARSVVLTFNPSDTVGDLRGKVAENFQTAVEQVSLTCVYPRKELGLDLDDTPLDQHGLVPSGVVIAKCKQHGSGSSAGGGALSLLYSLIQFILQLFVSLKNGIAGLFSGPAPSQTPQSQNSNSFSTRGKSNDNNNLRIRRVKAEDNDDDPNNTYNGNSTQQQ